MSHEMKVLIVEDEPRLREVLLRAVRDMGFAPSGCRSGEEALRTLEADGHDIVMLDLNLPGMSGMEMLEQVRKRWPATQTVILTGYGDLDTAKRAIRLDAVDFLTKPCPLGEIEGALDRARQRVPRELPGSVAVAEAPAISDQADGRTMDVVERHHILAALDRHQGNRTAAAAELGISVRKLYYRLAEYERRGTEES